MNLRRQLREGGQLRAGDSLEDGRYLLLDRVGRGGFAVVWRAYDRQRDESVAIKVLHANLAGDPIRRDRFFRGAKTMQALEHEAVVRVLEPRGNDGGFYYFVMELLAGDLQHEVLNGRLPPERVVSIVVSIGDALALAHRKGLVHRDVKPANILLNAVGAPRLTDFDLVSAGDTTGGTRTGAMGSFIYASPELLSRPQDANASADVYGLGMTAIFGLHGAELPMEVVQNASAFIGTLSAPEPIKDVLKRAVAWHSEARFESAAELCSALRGVTSAWSDAHVRSRPIIDVAALPAREAAQLSPRIVGNWSDWSEKGRVAVVTFVYAASTDEEFIELHIGDFDKKGIFIRTISPFPLSCGNLLRFDICIQEDRKIISGVGRIAWIRLGADATYERPAGIGIRFIKLAPEPNALVERAVERLQATDGVSAYEEGTPRPDQPAIPASKSAQNPAKPAQQRASTMLGLGSIGGSASSAPVRHAELKSLKIPVVGSSSETEPEGQEIEREPGAIVDLASHSSDEELASAIDEPPPDESSPPMGSTTTAGDEVTDVSDGDAAAAEPQQSAPAAVPARILLIDYDTPFARELQARLRHRGYWVAFTDDGIAAIEEARADPPDMIVLSVELPRINGYTVCRNIKNDVVLRRLPLVLLSSESNEETFEQHRKLRTHANVYFHMPVQFDELIGQIVLLVEERH